MLSIGNGSNLNGGHDRGKPCHYYTQFAPLTRLLCGTALETIPVDRQYMQPQ